MPIIDIIIAVAILISVVVGIFRGFVREAISVAALLFAIWAALYFGPALGSVTDTWLNSEELRRWFGRVLVFAVVLLLGALLGWGISKIVHLSALSGVDRFLGALFGTGRGILLVAVAIIGAQYAGFDNDEWWMQSRLIPHFEVVADWIKVMAPEGLDVILPDEEAEALPVQV
jgi:membrane protein required for colicin V production